jgi:methylthioribose-1-phosphate isomerase
MAAPATQSLWWDGEAVAVIDQRALPHALVVNRWYTLHAIADGIRSMEVRGAPLIGLAAAHALALAMRSDPSDESLQQAVDELVSTRPTAVNLRWAVERVQRTLLGLAPAERASAARALASAMVDDDVRSCRAIGEVGLGLLREVHDRTGRSVRVLTHCNAGWLACIRWGTALAPVYLAHEAGIPVHVWVSETRPRNQGAALTAWELGRGGVPHTLVVDNAAGHLLRAGEVDLVLVGADRIAANGDTANKVGTYLKAVAARDCGVPFHVAAPASTFDPLTPSGDEIPIEERAADEVLVVNGGPIAPPGTAARNWGFDVTPARLITSFVTDRGVVAPERVGEVLGS